MSTTIPEPQTFFSGRLTRELSSTETVSMYMSSNETLGISSFYCVVEPKNSKREIIKISSKSGTNAEYTLTIASRGLAVSGADTEVSGNKWRHGVNAEVIISDNHNFLKTFIDAFNVHEDLASNFHGVAGIGVFASAPSAASNSGKLYFATDSLVLYYSDGATWTAQSAGTVPDATTTVKGIAKASVAPASATTPIFVGDNDPRMLTTGQLTDLTDGGTTTLHTHLGVAYTCGEAIAVNQVCYLDSTDNKVYKASTTNIGNDPIIGFSITSTAGTGETIYIVYEGVLPSTGLTAGTVMYNGSAGAISATCPATNDASITPWRLGTAMSTTTFYFKASRIPRIIMHATGDLTSTATNTITVGFKIKNVDVTGYLTQDAVSSITTNVVSGGKYDAIQNLMYYPGGTGAVFAGSAGTAGTARSANVTTALSGLNLNYTWTASSGSPSGYLCFAIYELI